MPGLVQTIYCKLEDELSILGHKGFNISSSKRVSKFKESNCCKKSQLIYSLKSNSDKNFRKSFLCLHKEFFGHLSKTANKKIELGPNYLNSITFQSTNMRNAKTWMDRQGERPNALLLHRHQPILMHAAQ